MEKKVDIFAGKDTPNSRLREFARQFYKENDEWCHQITPPQMDELKETRRSLRPSEKESVLKEFWGTNIDRHRASLFLSFMGEHAPRVLNCVNHGIYNLFLEQ